MFRQKCKLERAPLWWWQTAFHPRPSPLLYNSRRGRRGMTRSAGLLLFRRRGPEFEFFLVHPGGPFWAKKDVGAWSIPKGLYEKGEPPLEAAKREFAEETGLSVDGDFVALGDFRQPGGRVVWVAV